MSQLLTLEIGEGPILVGLHKSQKSLSINSYKIILVSQFFCLVSFDLLRRKDVIKVTFLCLISLLN